MDKDGYHGYDKPSMKVEGPRHVVCQCDKCKTENQEPVGRFAKFTDGIWREVTDYSAGVPLYTRPQPKQEDYLSKAYRLANELRCHLAIAPAPQHRKWVDLTGEELETLLSENRPLSLGAIWAVADKLKEKNT